MCQTSKEMIVSHPLSPGAKRCKQTFVEKSPTIVIFKYQFIFWVEIKKDLK